MRYTEFKSNDYKKILREFLSQQFELNEAKFTDDIIDKIIANTGALLKTELSSAKSIDDVVKLLHTNVDFPKIKDILKNSGFKDIVIDKGIQNVSKAGTTATSSPLTGGTKTKSTSKKQATPSVDAVKKALNHINREVEGPDTHKNMLTTLYADAMQEINNNNTAAAVDMLKNKLKEIDAELAKVATKPPVTETASSGGTSAGSVASLNAPLGAVIRRMPPGQSFFAPTAETKKHSKKAKVRKKHKNR